MITKNIQTNKQNKTKKKKIQTNLRTKVVSRIFNYRNVLLSVNVVWSVDKKMFGIFHLEYLY